MLSEENGKEDNFLPSALSFDDGPHVTHTPKLLNVLERAGVKACFFYIGERVAQAKDLIVRAASEGHDIGNHSWSHKRFTDLSDGDLKEELGRTHDILGSLVGRAPTLMRPPFGSISPRQRELAKEWFGYEGVLWNIDTQDWQKPRGRKVEQAVIDHAGSGNVILMHDIYSETVAAVERAFEKLGSPAGAFTTVSELRRLIQTK